MKAITRRSDCPISFGLDIFGDKWSLLIVRDLALTEKRTYQEFLESKEGVATNILVSKLRLLEESGIVSKKRDLIDKRKTIYTLTKKGVDLVPILVAITEWGAKYDPKSATSQEFVRSVRMKASLLASEQKTKEQAR